MATKLHGQLIAFAVLAYVGRGLCFGLAFGGPFMRQAFSNPYYHGTTFAAVLAATTLMSSVKRANIRPFLGILLLVVFGWVSTVVAQFLRNQPIDPGIAFTRSAGEFIGAGMLGALGYSLLAVPIRKRSGDAHGHRP